MLLEICLDRTLDVGKAEDEPVEEEDGEAGVILGKGVSLRSVDAKETVQPVEMREICGKNAEDFQLEPAHFQDDGHQADRQEDAGAQAIHAVLAQTYCEI